MAVLSAAAPDAQPGEFHSLIKGWPFFHMVAEAVRVPPPAFPGGSDPEGVLPASQGVAGSGWTGRNVLPGWIGNLPGFPVSAGESVAWDWLASTQTPAHRLASGR